MRTAIFTPLLVLGLGLSVTAAPPDQPPAPKAPSKEPVLDMPQVPGPLEGAYTIVSGERNGEAIPAAELKDASVRFSNGELIGRDKDQKVFIGAMYTLDTTKKPWTLTLKDMAPLSADQSDAPAPAPVARFGLAKKEGDVVTFVYALPGGETPAEFKTKGKQQMFVLKSYLAAPPMPSKFEKP
jgi:uncharacterized protein (TIGR03067 family)